MKTLAFYILLVLVIIPSLVLASSVDELFEAAKAGNSSQIRRILSAGVDVNSRNNDKVTPLQVAVNWNQLDAVKALLSHGANPNYVGGNLHPALHVATGRDTEIVKVLLKAGANVNLPGGYGYTPLQLAAGNRDETFRTLLKNGGYHGPVPKRIETVKLLIEAGADLNSLDSGGTTPLSEAMSRNNLDIAEILLKAGANIHQRLRFDRDRMQWGDTVLMQTISYSPKSGTGYVVYKDTKPIELLLRFGANPNDRNEDMYRDDLEAHGGWDWRGYSALTYSAKRGMFNVVKLLLEHGADVNLPRTDGKTALQLARENSHPQTAELIKNYVKKNP
jgi:ankyrin repeat protein